MRVNIEYISGDTVVDTQALEIKEAKHVMLAHKLVNEVKQYEYENIDEPLLKGFIRKWTSENSDLTYHDLDYLIKSYKEYRELNNINWLAPAKEIIKQLDGEENV